MKVNPTYVHIGQINKDGTQNISLYDHKIKSYAALTTSANDINLYVKETNKKRREASIITGVSSFAGGFGMTCLFNMISKSPIKLNPLFWGFITTTAFTFGHVGDSFVYRTQNEKFINNHSK